MKNFKNILWVLVAAIAVSSCSSGEAGSAAGTTSTETENAGVGQSGVSDDVSQKNILQVAIGSKDHSTLVAAVKAADLANTLANAGPFTVFAPTNAAFDKLPKGTVEDLLKPENKEKLADILQYHVSVGVFTETILQDGQTIGQANSANIKITKKGDKIMVNDKANVIGTVQASNGLVYIIDEVLLPPSN
ncbi:MAG: fasciclin domain-containing protein [Bacteroidetes bacterium]|nr:fasciclin domain-containing protein [Bacteroidota bacterium]